MRAQLIEVVIDLCDVCKLLSLLDHGLVLRNLLLHDWNRALYLLRVSEKVGLRLDLLEREGGLLGLGIQDLVIDVLSLGNEGLPGLLLEPIAYLVSLLGGVCELLGALKFCIHLIYELADYLVLKVGEELCVVRINLGNDEAAGI